MSFSILLCQFNCAVFRLICGIFRYLFLAFGMCSSFNVNGAGLAGVSLLLLAIYYVYRS